MTLLEIAILQLTLVFVLVVQSFMLKKGLFKTLILFGAIIGMIDGVMKLCNL